MKKTNFTVEQKKQINTIAIDMASNAVHFLSNNSDCPIWTASAWSENEVRAEAIYTAQEILTIMGYDVFMSKPKVSGGCYLVLTVSIKTI